MADFRVWPPGSRANFSTKGPSNPDQARMFPGPALQLAIGKSDSVALWGGGPEGQDLVVMVLDSSVARITQIQSIPSQSIRVFRVTGASRGVSRIEARLPDRSVAPGTVLTSSSGASWANMSVSVVEAVSPFEEALPDFGPDAPCRLKPNYVDYVQSGSYDVASGDFTVVHDDGTTIPLDFDRLSAEFQSAAPKAITYFRDKRNNKIYPRVFSQSCAPNLADMVKKTAEGIGGAEFFQQFGRGILDLLPLEGLSGSPTGPSTATGRVRRFAGRGRKSAVPRGATEVRLTPEQYRKALSHVFPSHSLDSVSSLVDGVAANAARQVSKDPRFLGAWAKNDMKLAGTLFHSAAANEIRRIPGSAVPSGWKIAAERTLKSGKGGGRADVFLEGPAGQIVEIDWKTTGSSAFSSKAVKQLEKHAGQIRVDGPVHLAQESRSWIDYVRGILPPP